MAASQFLKQQEKEKKEGVRVVDDSLQVEDVSKEGSPSESAVSSSSVTGSAATAKANHFHNQSQTADQSLSSYQTAATYGYYYPGFSGSVGDFHNQGYYIAGNAVDPQFPFVQADAGSFVYVPGVYPGYDPYTSYMPVSTIVDGQYAGQQVFSPSPVCQSQVPSPELNAISFPHGDYLQTPYLWGSSLLAGDVAFANGYFGFLDIPPAQPISSTPVASSAPHSKSSKLSNSTTNLSVDVLSGHNKKQKALNKASSHIPSFQADLPAQGYHAVANFPMYNQGKGGYLYSNNLVNSRTNVKGWGGPEKSKTRSKVNSVDDVTLLKGNNHGHVTTNAKNALVSGGKAADSSATDEVGNGSNITFPILRDQYNLPEFSITYDHAFFFVIKSYSEDDIHKSIKYNVWASTPNGNKRLNNAYEDAQKLGSKSPVFLFFSVNASGQFCGVAEMIGRVDFNKSMDFWQQSKWNGYFPVKWHIIKDIPNSQLRHIILENNENKPVTNSRDTQEVKFDQGIDMLSIFKSFTSNTSILDDFDFYENRQKIMQEKRIRQSVNHHDLQLKVDQLTSGFQAVDLSSAKNT